MDDSMSLNTCILFVDVSAYISDGQVLYHLLTQYAVGDLSSAVHWCKQYLDATLC